MKQDQNQKKEKLCKIKEMIWNKQWRKKGPENASGVWEKYLQNVDDINKVTDAA